MMQTDVVPVPDDPVVTHPVVPPVPVPVPVPAPPSAALMSPENTVTLAAASAAAVDFLIKDRRVE